MFVIIYIYIKDPYQISLLGGGTSAFILTTLHIISSYKQLISKLC